MSKILNTDDLLSLLETIGRPDEVELVVDALSAASLVIAQHYGVDIHDTSYQPGFAGLCTTFQPAHEGQDCPEELSQLDADGEWGN